MIVARIERLEAADIRDTDTRSLRVARHAEAVHVPFQASGLLRTKSSSPDKTAAFAWKAAVLSSK
jgi:hypothetical protein